MSNSEKLGKKKTAAKITDVTEDLVTVALDRKIKSDSPATVASFVPIH